MAIRVLKIQFAGELYHDGNLPLGLLVDGFLPLECTRNSVRDTSHPHQVQSATVIRLIQRTNYSTHPNVYQALLDNTLNVVLKLGVTPASRARVEREADNYETSLREFWGTIVPISHGLYKGQGTRPGKPGNDISCLVLEYAGEFLEDLESLPLHDKRTIMTMLGKLHSVAKLHPKDFHARNIVQQNGAYRLIDFHDLKMHGCQFKGDFQWHELRTTYVPCSFLQAAGDDMQVWDPEPDPEVNLGMYTYAAFRYPSQQFIDAVVEPHMLEPHNMMQCYAWLKGVRIYMDDHGIPVENDYENKELRAYTDSVRPVMPLTRAEAQFMERLEETGTVVEAS